MILTACLPSDAFPTYSEASMKTVCVQFLAMPVEAAAVLLGIYACILNALSGIRRSDFSLTYLEKLLTTAVTGIHSR